MLCSDKGIKGKLKTTFDGFQLELCMLKGCLARPHCFLDFYQMIL